MANEREPQYINFLDEENVLRISDLIERLEKTKERRGNLIVCTQDDNIGYIPVTNAHSVRTSGYDKTCIFRFGSICGTGEQEEFVCLIKTDGQ